jgi:hypothetical protein
MKVWLPINVGVFLDQECRESVGLEPDLWVPAADAVNSVVAAVRRGTITTRYPLPRRILAQRFVPENPFIRRRQEAVRFGLVIAGFAAAGLLWSYSARRKPRLVLAVGVVSLVAGSMLTVRQKQPVGVAIIIVGIIYLLMGGISALRWDAGCHVREEP